VIILIKL